ncbi:O89/O101/O162 family O-antigen export ABC transporter permease subunit [Escherichia coli]|uniref:O89/O101/O162 family O-antigen export ABC transporter permease subunit n=1 Tax=Escherichia coli TaxID=562 RepID=UPI001EEDAD14|nr:O89/O101/O162 family O-antigen export ABC transporter permease subunit [Escherichia coli]MCF7347617.1 O89/O101/O162 family O-antigen export ABC transporter permease subunit [Escherichia coli]HCD8636855.1 O89/O101/O162 family O-antigen export ABC transporter permease subunit [Escherichia coli]
MKESLTDIYSSIKSWHLWTTLGWLELRQRYKRSIVGPFWITLSMAVLIIALGVIYGELFKLEVKEYLPMLAVGLVFWNFISGVINEGCVTFISSSSFISQLPTKKFIYIMQMLWRNFMMLCHNIVIVIGVLIIFNVFSLKDFPLFILGFMIVVVNLIWIATLFAVISVRFRDFPQMVMSFMQVVFYITPILFSGTMLAKYSLLLKLNPFAWFIEIIRSPLVGKMPELYCYYNSIILACVGTVISLITFAKCRNRIAYWV